MEANTVTAYSTAILCIVTAISVIFVAYQAFLIRKQSEQETKRKQLQAITQLEGRKTELLDLHMSLIQKKLDCERFKIQRYRWRPNAEDEKYIINLEYSREMEFADNRIVDVTKSFGLLVETLSAIQYLFGNVPEIESKIKNIIQNEYFFKNIIEERIKKFNIDVNIEMDKFITTKVSGKQLQDLIDNNINKATRELSSWIIINFINLIDSLSKELWLEIGKNNGETDSEAPGYNDPMYDKIKASMENEQSPVITLSENMDNVDKAPLDGLLQSLAKFTEDRKVELPITLFIRGAIVSGMLIGYTHYFELFEKMIRCLTSNTLEGAAQIKMLADSLKKAHEENISKLEKLSPKARDAAMSETRYIYLRQAEIVRSNGAIIPIGTEGLLRTRTNSIDSFSVGAIRSRKEKSMTGATETQAELEQANKNLPGARDDQPGKERV